MKCTSINIGIKLFIAKNRKKCQYWWRNMRKHNSPNSFFPRH